MKMININSTNTTRKTAALAVWHVAKLRVSVYAPGIKVTKQVHQIPDRYVNISFKDCYKLLIALT
jgi:hypothetical protein